jgi:hypothetical protein
VFRKYEGTIADKGPISMMRDGLRETACESEDSRLRNYLAIHKEPCLLEFRKPGEEVGDLYHLDDDIRLARESLESCPREHRQYPELVKGLIPLLGTHFKNTGCVSFLDEVIAFANDEYVPENQWIACNIAEALLHRALLASTSTAALLLRKATKLLASRLAHSAPKSDREKAFMYHTLGQVYDLEVDLGMEIDHEFRLGLARNAFALNNDTFENSVDFSITLVMVLVDHASRISNITLLDEAEDILLEALKNETLGYMKAPLMALQAKLHSVRALVLGMPFDLKASWHILEAVVTDASARPRDRLRIAIRWAAMAEKVDSKTAMFAYRHAVDILPQVGCLGEDLVGRVQALRQARDLAPRSASFALGLGEVEQAVELLEHSRGVLWRQSLHLRPPLHLLPPYLAAQLAEVVKQLDGGETDSSQRQKAAQRFQRIIQEVREQSGCEEFSLPRTYDQLVGRLPDGYVVWLIPRKAHCDIVILNTRIRTRPVHLRHAGLNLDRLHAIASAFMTVHAFALRSVNRKTRPAPLPKINDAFPSHDLLLEELWTSLVQMVIQALDIPVSHL